MLKLRCELLTVRDQIRRRQDLRSLTAWPRDTFPLKDWHRSKAHSMATVKPILSCDRRDLQQSHTGPEQESHGLGREQGDGVTPRSLPESLGPPPLPFWGCLPTQEWA